MHFYYYSKYLCYIFTLAILLLFSGTLLYLDGVQLFVSSNHSKGRSIPVESFVSIRGGQLVLQARDVRGLGSSFVHSTKVIAGKNVRTAKLRDVFRNNDDE